LVDISHEIMPQDVRQAAYVLYTVYPFFLPHAVHLVVVDPGVGSARRPIALRTPAGYFVGPDNGVFSYVMACESVETLVEPSDPRYRLAEVSRTFHGRDVFAPAAAHLAAGVPITALGPPVPDPVTFPLPRLEVTPSSITGEVLHADRFGNVITSIGRLAWDWDELSLEPAFQAVGQVGNLSHNLPDRDELSLEPVFQEAGKRNSKSANRRVSGPADRRTLEGGGRVHFKADEAVVVVAGQEIASVHHTYSEVERGQVLALVGSEAHLEIAVREGSGARRLGLRPGDPVVLRWR
jgi:S-adenosylmethionine hydrolase